MARQSMGILMHILPAACLQVTNLQQAIEAVQGVVGDMANQR
jgi:hypothetical protein